MAMLRVGIVGWRGMVGSVLVQRMREERDFDHVEPVFFSTSQAGGQGPAIGKATGPVKNATDLAELKLEADKYTSGSITRDFIGSGPHVREGSPAQNAAKIAAPVLMFHGTLDQNVDIEQARMMKRALTASGKSVELVEYPGLAHSLTELGLIDEYRIYLHPVVLGSGTPYFAGPRPPLRLLAHDRIDEDVIRLRYVPA